MGPGCGTGWLGTARPRHPGHLLPTSGGLGLFPQWTQIEGNIFRPVEFYDTLGMPPLPGWTLVVQGGQPRDDGENIDVQHEDVLAFALVKEDSEQESGREGDESSGGDDMEDDGSDVGRQPHLRQ